METKHLRVTGENISKIVSEIKEKLYPEIKIESADGKTFLFTGESYSFWQDSNMAVTLFIDLASSEKCDIHVIASGGKIGLLQWDLFGREANRVDNVFSEISSICHHNNWKLEARIA